MSIKIKKGILRYLLLISFVFSNVLSAGSTTGYFTSVFINGDPLGGGTSGTYSAIRYFPTPTTQNSDASVLKDIALNKDVGTVWGLAYDSKNKILYASALLKRHCGLGPLGLGGIYKIDVSDLDNPAVSQFITVSDVGTVKSNSNRDLPADSIKDGNQYPSHDPIFDEIGRIGLGDLDISPDGQTLYTVNLKTKKLVLIDVPTKTEKASYAITNPFSSCPADDSRPWAVKVKTDGAVYVGSTCDNDTDQGVAVSKFDTATHSFTTVTTKSVTDDQRDPPDYRDSDNNANQIYPDVWLTDNTMTTLFGGGDYPSYVQLMLSDIEFDKDGNIILGMIDRTGLQGGYRNYSPDTSDSTLYFPMSGGDVQRICNVGGTYYPEGTAKCPFNDEPKDSRKNEYYVGDAYYNSDDGKGHRETALGGVAYDPETDRVASSSYDPVDNYSTYTNGVIFLDNQNGQKKASQLLAADDQKKVSMGKAGGVGDVEALDAPPPTVCLGDTVWDDNNQNGLQDETGAGVKGVTVNLLDKDGNLLKTMPTDDNGNYKFCDLTAGDYYVEFKDLPAGYQITQKDAGDDTKDSDADPSTGKTAKITLGTKDDMTWDAGIYKAKACLGDYVWDDANKNGLQDSGERGVAGVKVYLLDSAGNKIAGKETTTDTDGKYSFCKLDPETYSVEFDLTTLPTDYVVTQKDAGDDTKDSDADTTTGKTAQTTLKAGDNDTKWDMGIYKKEKACIGDYVWYDDNQDGIQDATEKPVKDITVKLLDSAGKELNTTKTDDNGIYSFCKLENGTYSVQFDLSTLPTSYIVTKKDAGSDDTKDSDANPSDGKTAQTTVQEGDNDIKWDMGIYKPKAHVNLEKHTNGVDADDAKDAPYIKVGDTVTWEYIVKNDGEEKLINVVVHDDTENKDASCPKIELAVGESMTCQLTATAVAGAYENTAQVNAKGSDSATTVKDTDPSHYYGSDPKIDIEKFTDDNDGNPQQADSETDADVPTLYVGKKVKWTYIVKNTGNVKLTDVKVTDDVEGAISCPNSELDVNATMTCTKEGTVKEGKYANEATVEGTPPTGSNDKVTDKDPSHYKGIEPACIGDYIWSDTNGDGIQDSGENGVKGAKVELFDDANKAVTDVDGNVKSAITTADDGKYKFCRLAPGKYHIVVTPPTGYVISPKDKGGDDAKDSDIDPTTGKTVDTQLDAGENDMTWDGGVYKPACIGDYIWLDTNANGIQEAGENGLANVKVELFKADNTKVTEMNTDTDGKYHFCKLVPGDYYVKVTPPAGDKISPKDKGGDDAKDSDIDPTTGKTEPTTLDAGEDDTSWDGGIYQPACIGDYVWDDKNANGIQETGESGIAGVTVELYAKDGAKLNSIDTNATGGYEFCDLTPGDYHIKVVKPTGYYISPKDKGGDDSKDSDIDPTDGTTPDTNIESGEYDHTLDAGLFKPACIGDYVWEDTNANGIQDSNESGVAGVKVELFKKGSTDAVVDADGNTVTLQTTQTDGKYLFCQLVPGEYHIKATTPDGYYVTREEQGSDKGKDSDLDPTFNSKVGTTKDTMLESGEKDLTWDGGIFRPACIGDYIWEDANANGIQESGEVGVAGAKLDLKDANGNAVTDVEGNAVAQFITKADGNYSFCKLVPGEYHVELTPPSGYYISRKDQGNDDSKDSDIDPFLNATKGVTPNETLVSGENNTTLDGGIFKPACLGDYVWKDTNANGIQEAGENPIKGVHVTIEPQTDSSGNKNLKDVLGNTLGTQDTDTNGKYQFCNLIPGDYSVKFKADPDSNGAPYITTKANSGDDSKDSDIPEFKLAEGETPTETLTSGENNKTLDAGFIQEICLGDYVWEDRNANGIQETDESPLANIPVKLMMKDTNNNWIDAKDVKGNPVDANKTDNKGNYKFCHLKPAIDYKIIFTKPQGYYVTDKDADNNSKDANDSDIDKQSTIVVVKPVKDDMTLDAGFYRPACIGDYIWEDTNANGIQDINESGVAGVKVELFKKGSADAVVDADGNTVTLQTTKTDGKYLFCQLVPGEYHIKATTPDGYYVTRKEQGANKAKDSDLDPTFNSKVGTTKDTMLESGEKDLTWDGGIFRPACIGDYIWEDKNANGIQESGESGVAGVELSLVDGNGNAVTNVNGDSVAPYTTTVDGNYSFCQLVPGEYQVKVTKLPDNYYITRDNKGGDDSKDSDISSFLTTTGDMPKTTLDSGEEDYTFDGGVFRPACIGDYVWKDKNVNGLQDDDEEPISGVKVQVVAQDGSEVTDIFGKAVTELQTDENGIYHQCNLIPNRYKVKFNAQPDENGAPYISTKQVDDEAKGSDIPEFTEQYGESQAVMLQSGDDYRDIDAGYIQEICLGDYVWFDENLNGIQDKSEPGVIDVPVNLTYTNGKAVTDVYGNPVKAIKTDKKGYYKFCHLLPARDYIIKFKVPKSYHPTKRDQGSDLKDSDADSEGKIYVKYPVRDDLTLDMGIYCDCDDYLVNPDEYHELKMPALNMLGLLAMVTAVFVLVRREE